jgi:hypothetical protein
MFDKFGEFDSAAEIAEAIQAQIDEGDERSAIEIGLENGIDEMDVEDILDGTASAEEVLTPCVVALGKLQIEAEAHKKNDSIIVDWIEYIKALAIDSEEIAKNIRKKGKSLNGCLGELLKFSYQHAFDIPQDIVKVAGITGAKVKLGIPNAGKCKEIIRRYYGA